MESVVKLTGEKPMGLSGRFEGRIMNFKHSNPYKSIIKRFIVERAYYDAGLSVLDVGCGGGVSIKIFSSLMRNSFIYGVDHSIDMVKLSRDVNKRAIKNRWVEIKEASIDHQPFKNESFDIVTAFDNIDYWDNFESCLKEIKRVLKPGGAFFIINDYPDSDSKNYKFAKFKSDREFRTILLKNDFKKVEINTIGIHKDTIVIKANK